MLFGEYARQIRELKPAEIKERFDRVKLIDIYLMTESQLRSIEYSQMEHFRDVHSKGLTDAELLEHQEIFHAAIGTLGQARLNENYGIYTVVNVVNPLLQDSGNPRAVSALSLQRIAPSAIKALDIAKLSPVLLATLSDEQLKNIDRLQIGLMTPNQFYALTDQQINLLVDTHGAQAFNVNAMFYSKRLSAKIYKALEQPKKKKPVRRKKPARHRKV